MAVDQLQNGRLRFGRPFRAARKVIRSTRCSAVRQGLKGGGEAELCALFLLLRLCTGYPQAGGNGRATKRELRGRGPSSVDAAQVLGYHLEYISHERLLFAGRQQADELIPLFTRQHMKMPAWHFAYRPSLRSRGSCASS